MVAAARQRSGDRDGGGVHPRRQQRGARARAASSGSGSGTRGCATATASRAEGSGPRRPGWPTPCAQPTGRSRPSMAADRCASCSTRSRSTPGAREAILARAEISSACVRRRHPGHRPRRPRAHRQRAGAERRGRQPGPRARPSPSGSGEAVRLGDAAARVEWGRGGVRVETGGRACERRRRRRRRRAGERDRTDRVRRRRCRPESATRFARVRYGHAAKLFVPLARAGAGRRGDERPRALLVLDRDRARRGADAGRQLLRRLAGGARAPRRRRRSRRLARLARAPFDRTSR